MTSILTAPPKIKCYHCGESCQQESMLFENKSFCCSGCKLVYEVLEENKLCTYYTLNPQPGISAKKAFHSEKFAYLDDEVVIAQMLDFNAGAVSKVTFSIPQIHCTSCIWLLENLYKLDAAIIISKVNFLKKEVYINFRNSKISLRKVVELLASIGYEPEIMLADATTKQKAKIGKGLIYKIGIAGFCFGNIMLLSLPEYFSGYDFFDGFRSFFSIISLTLALPVFFYCAEPYFRSAFSGIKAGRLNIDVPIVLGFISLFVVSLVDIIVLKQPGYFDTFTGLVFFLLLGRLYQQQTYQFLSFERDYKSYFPISVTVLNNHAEKVIPVANVKRGMRIAVRNGELIPADSILAKGKALIDYSFVTGESEPVAVAGEEQVFAGGRQTGECIELIVVKEPSQSYLTQLWNHDTFLKKEEKNLSKLSDSISKWFTIVILTIAFGTLGYWLWADQSMALKAFTSILIIACPCAFALSIPFILGNTLRIFGKKNFYLKNTEVIERLANADTIVFDKTGTLTSNNEVLVNWEGRPLTWNEKSHIKSVLNNSGHPLSIAINKTLTGLPIVPVINFKEETGKGVSGLVNEDYISIKGGSQIKEENEELKGSRSYVWINGDLIGYFIVRSKYRDGLMALMNKLKNHYRLYVLSGDNSSEKDSLNELFGMRAELHFNQTPQNKLDFIEALEKSGQKVVMLGDGLNDAGALKRSYAGIAVAEDIHHFTPASDAILDGNTLCQLDKMLSFSKTSLFMIKVSFAVSLVYNAIALSLAMQGTFTPVISAILMPISSVTLIAFASFSIISAARLKHLL